MKAVVLFLVFVCATSMAVADDAERGKAENDIREAIYRYQFLHLNKEADGRKVYFLTALDYTQKDPIADPNDDLMKRFANHKPPVKKQSQAIHLMAVPRDKETKEEGVLFRVDDITWVSDTEVKVLGSVHWGYLAAEGNIYSLKKEKGKWTVTKCVGDWFS